MSKQYKGESLDEKLRFAKAKYVAYIRVQQSSETILTRIATERAKLDEEERYVRLLLAEIDNGAIGTAETEITKFQQEIDHRRETKNSRGSSRGEKQSPLERKLAKHKRLAAKIKELSNILNDEEMQILLDSVQRS